MFCLFVRFLPMVATAEVKGVLPQADPHHGSGLERESKEQRAAWPPHRTPEPSPGGAH
jgi:hypothetical protein